MSSSKVRRKLPWWKKLLFSLVATVLFFVLLEVVLAVAGVQPLSEREDPFAGFSPRLAHFETSVAEDGETVVRLSATKRKHLHDLQFKKRKAPGVTRVFCVGGSTTYGRPFWDETSFAGWVRALLEVEEPEQPWEVLNAGGISYASYRVVAVMRELAEFDPDVFVVYVGQNEFLEYRTYQDLIDAPAFLRETSALLSRTRIATVVHGMFGGGRTSGHSAGELPDLRAVDSVGPEAYVRDEPMASHILTQFRAALAEMVKIARGAGARIVFVAPASNLADFAPFKSEHRAGLTPEEMDQSERERYLGEVAAKAHRWSTALERIEKAERVDDRFAALHYLKGKVLTALGRHADAGAAFRRAKDEDIVPLRATSQIVDAVRAMGAQSGVGLVDFEAIAMRHAEDGIPGDALFADHVHPKIHANGLLAEAIVGWLLERAPSKEGVATARQRVQAAVDRPRYAAELVKLSRMLESLGQGEAALLRVEEALALDAGSFEIELRLSRLELAHGRLDSALARLERLVEAKPESAAVHAGLGIAYAGKGRSDLAREHWERSVELDPKAPAARERLGVLAAGKGDFKEAIAHFQVVVRAKPDSAQAHSNLGLAYAKDGDAKQAEACYQAALERDARYVSAHYNYALLLEAAGRGEQALEHLKAALRADRGHAGARKALLRLGYRVE